MAELAAYLFNEFKWFHHLLLDLALSRSFLFPPPSYPYLSLFFCNPPFISLSTAYENSLEFT